MKEAGVSGPRKIGTVDVGETTWNLALSICIEFLSSSIMALFPSPSFEFRVGDAHGWKGSGDEEMDGSVYEW